MTPIRSNLACLLALAGLGASLEASAACTVQSPAHRVAVVELYTSQGCSSCPPADRWLSALTQRYPPTQAIPLALHVGYWDYIGWKDPFAKREFNERQRQWAAANQNQTVYTPGVFVQGRETRDWHAESSLSRRVQATNAMPAGAQIELAAAPDGPQLRVQVSAAAAANPGAELRLALVQSGLSTAVNAGENKGEKLGNDHVVREWSAALPMGRHELSFNIPAGAKGPQLAVVALVQAGAGKELLQALQWTAAACRG